MEPRKHNNFDEFAENYNEVHTKSLEMSGADRDYFSMYKIAGMVRH
jgi:hypothetical protein